MLNSKDFENLVKSLSKLPGIGKKTAIKYSFDILNMTFDDVKKLSEDLINLKKNIKFCNICGNYTDQDICQICQKRNKKIICVVSDAKDIISIEKANIFDGVYHVLGGLIEPIKGILPDSLRIQELLNKIKQDKVEEIIFAFKLSQESNITANYIFNSINEKDIKITRLSQGISLGSDFEYLDEYTMKIALSDRVEIKA